MLQQRPEISIRNRPYTDAEGEECPEGGPGLRDCQHAVAPGEGGETVSAVEGAEEAFGSGLNEGGGRDCEFPDAEPAGAAVDVGG